MFSLKRLALIVGSGALVLSTAPQASADSITFSLDCDIQGPVCNPVAPAVGEITVTDNGSFVDIAVSFTSGNIQGFWLNYTGPAPTPGVITFKSTGGAVTYNPLAQADGYNVAFFDLIFPDGETSPFTTTLRLSDDATDLINTNLDASMFNARTSPNNALYAAAQKTGGSSYFGSTSCTGCTTVQSVVPEPASLLLLGTGLAAGATGLRRRQRAARK